MYKRAAIVILALIGTSTVLNAVIKKFDLLED